MTCLISFPWILNLRDEKLDKGQGQEEGRERGRNSFMYLGYKYLSSTQVLDSISCLRYCCCLVTKSCPALCNLMNCSTPGFPVLHCLPGFAQTHEETINRMHRALSPCSCILIRRNKRGKIGVGDTWMQESQLGMGQRELGGQGSPLFLMFSYYLFN